MNSFLHNTCTAAVCVGLLVVLLIAIGFLSAVFGGPILSRF
ncbi:MAG: hypothetical protein AAFR21_03380 [Pseudomonadota bacterium]